jgi:hypothetical protein
LQDWVTYGDQVAKVTVLAEQRIPAPQEEVKRGEGHIMRTVLLAVERPSWTRPTLKKPAVAFPKRITVLNGGWVFHGQQEARLVFEDDPWMNVGGVYMAVLTFGSVNGGEPDWFLLAQTTLNSGVVDPPANDHRQAARTLAGKVPAEVASSLRATKPDRRAAKYMSDDPVLRWRRISKATMQPGPGER